MAAFKIILLFAVTVACVKSYSLKEDGIIQPRVIVRESNLSIGDQDKVAGALQRVYDGANTADRAGAFRKELDKIFPSRHNTVLINAQATSYEGVYFIRLYINADDVLAFGLGKC